jgi:hypothetical protein
MRSSFVAEVELLAELANIDLQLQNITVMLPTLNDGQQAKLLARSNELYGDRRRLEAKLAGLN